MITEAAPIRCRATTASPWLHSPFSVADFKAAFVAKGAGQFGSGWAWLVENNGKLEVTSTPNGVNPLCFSGQKALLGCDVWEHSYYIDYRNRRPDYVNAFLDSMVDWEGVAGRL